MVGWVAWCAVVVRKGDSCRVPGGFPSQVRGRRVFSLARSTATVDGNEAIRQIEQMCRFIEQEAKEKVEEIEMKTEQDHDKEEQTLLVEGRIALKSEFEKKNKELKVRKRM